MNEDNIVTVITVTLSRSSLKEACESIDRQTFGQWHHYVLGDGVLPDDYASEKRSTLGFSKIMGITEPGANMPNGTPNPMLRWALRNIALGKYVCFLDDDNIYKPDYLDKMVDALDQNPDVGIVLCGAEDLRYFQKIDGYPEAGRCDNSAFLLRSEIASVIEYPHASMEKNVEQDVEFIKLCAEYGGYVRLPEKLLIFGSGMNLPPNRGRYFFLESWKKPQEAYYLAYSGNLTVAAEMLTAAVELNRFDAWSVWKLFEIYSLVGNLTAAERMLVEWERMYIESGTTHYANIFSYAVLLRFLKRPYMEILEAAKKKLFAVMQTENEAAEHFYTMALFCLFGHKTERYLECLGEALRLNSSEDFWAYRETVWQLRVFSHIFPGFENVVGRFLNDVKRLC